MEIENRVTQSTLFSVTLFLRTVLIRSLASDTPASVAPLQEQNEPSPPTTVTVRKFLLAAPARRVVPPSRQAALAATLAALALVTAVVLFEVLGTVVFAVTLAYVLSPVRTAAAERGASPRVAAGLATGIAMSAVVALVAPVGYVLYRRRRAAFAVFESLPEMVPVSVGEITYTVTLAPLIVGARELLTDAAFSVAAAAPVLLLKTLVLLLLVYGLLYRPSAVRIAVTRALPAAYHEPLFALDRRVAATLRSIYVLQAATALGTFLLGAGTFWLLGYDSPVVLGVLSGVLQFVPVVGPSVVVVALAGVELLAGETVAAVTVTVVGLVVVGFVPDAVIRTRLAEYTAELPVSLYFVGFVGGVLTVGSLGFVLGPVVVALLVETVRLLADGVDGSRRRLDTELGPHHPDGPFGLRYEPGAGGSPESDDTQRSDRPRRGRESSGEPKRREETRASDNSAESNDRADDGDEHASE